MDNYKMIKIIIKITNTSKNKENIKQITITITMNINNKIYTKINSYTIYNIDKTKTVRDKTKAKNQTKK